MNDGTETQSTPIEAPKCMSNDFGMRMAMNDS